MTDQVPYLFDWESKLSQDECAKLARSRANECISDYMLFNYFNNGDCNKTKELNKLALEHPNLRFRIGYGVACVIDDDSKARYSSDITHGPEKRQLYVRNFHAIPDFARGAFAPNTESMLINGVDTSSDKQCNRLSELDYDRFTPYTRCFGMFIKKAQRAIPDALPIGLNSVDLVRSQFKSKCSS
jgi:hypothetical protein